MSSRRRGNVQREAQDQRAYFKWIRTRWVHVDGLDIPLAGVAYHVPNGGKREPKEGAMLKAEGVLAGVSDIVVPIPVDGHHGLYIELKAPGGTPTPAQIAFLEYLRHLQYMTAIVTGWDAARVITETYLRPVLDAYYRRSTACQKTPPLELTPPANPRSGR